MNKAILIGRITANPDLKMTPSGVPVLKFTIAINRGFKKDGEDPKADFIQCVAWDKLAENMSNYLNKGSKIALEGRIQTSNYVNKDGIKVYTTQVTAAKVQFLEAKKQKDQPQPQPHPKSDFNNGFSNFDDEFNISDDDLPF